MIKFSVTYEIVTPESAEYGDCAEQGFIGRDLKLWQALAYVTQTRTAHCGGVECIEPSCSDTDQASWVTVYNGMEFLTGAQESRALHFPDGVTPSSKGRIMRLIENGI